MGKEENPRWCCSWPVGLRVESPAGDDEAASASGERQGRRHRNGRRGGRAVEALEGRCRGRTWRRGSPRGGPESSGVAWRRAANVDFGRRRPEEESGEGRVRPEEKGSTAGDGARTQAFGGGLMVGGFGQGRAREAGGGGGGEWGGGSSEEGDGGKPAVAMGDLGEIGRGGRKRV